jgi:hypothetical protein
LKRLFLCVVLAAAAIGLQRIPTADAVSGTLFTSKVVPLSFMITPSPVAYMPNTATGRIAIAAAKRARRRAPLVGGSVAPQVAFDPFAMQDVVAQATPQGNVKVQFTVKVDPTAQYLHVIPVVSTPIALGYGSNTVTCAFQVYAYYPSYPYYVTDFVQGSTSSGSGGANNQFPTYNYPTVSLLQWLAETKTTSFVAYTNSGLPGQTVFSGSAGQKQTVCIDLSVNVPSTVPSGSYSTALQYNLYVE